MKKPTLTILENHKPIYDTTNPIVKDTNLDTQWLNLFLTQVYPQVYGANVVNSKQRVLYQQRQWVST